MGNLEISAIIPAYNENKTLRGVLEPINQIPEITEVLVVDDGSTDNTADIAQEIPGVKVLHHDKNKGKTQAVITGVAAAKNNTIFLFDADLINLTKEHIAMCINKYTQGYDMVLMDKGSQPWVLRRLIKSIPAETGTRILQKSVFEQIPLKSTDRFQLEVRINNYFLEHNLRVAVSPAPEVYDPRKYVKYPFFIGLLLDIKSCLEIATTDGLMSIPKNLRTFHIISKLQN